MGAACSTGGDFAVQPFSNGAVADSTVVETKRGDEKVSIGATAGSSAVEICAAALVEELKVDRKVALRFARARQGNFNKAEPFLRADLAWRAQKTPALQADCPTALASGNLRMLGCTSTGIPVLFVHVGLWDPSAYDVDEYERYLIYFGENVLRTSGSEKFVMIFDLHGWKLSHVGHMRKAARLLSTLQD